MINRNELAQYVQDLLDTTKYIDYAPNGIQIEGKSVIKRICTAVSASEEVILQAILWQADALLVHHGYFWRGEELTLTGMKRRRITKLLSYDINLMAYHLPLDCHLELGNNACLAKFFSFKSVKTHKVGSIDNLLWSGVLERSITANALAEQIEIKLKRKPLHIAGHDKPITSIAWCSGGAQDYIEEAYKLGIDAYLSGEVSERTFYQAQELGVHYYACGHHATERYGIQALGQHLAIAFQLEHLFIDSCNPI